MIIDTLHQYYLESKAQHIPIISEEKAHWVLQIVQTNKPKEILELGTANGYSGTILGSEGAHVTTVDRDHRSSEAKSIFQKHNIAVTQIIEDGVIAVNQLTEQNKKFDLIFIDFEKKKYKDVVENCIKMLTKDGIIIADNISNSKCEEFVKIITNHPKLKTKIIDIGDKLTFSQLKHHL